MPSQPPGLTLVAVDPTAIEDTTLTLQAGSQITFGINVTNSPPINGFYVSLLYNTTVLSVAKNGLNTQQSVLLQTGGQIYPVVECVDGFTVAGTSCTPYVDTTGVISVQLTAAPGTTPNPTNGLLFSITFNVIATGVDQIHFLRSVLLNGSTSSLPNQPVDGFFSNKMCGGSQFCTYPIVHVDVTPATPFELSPAVHNASLTTSPNPGAKIIAYSWTWDGPSVLGYNLGHFENSSSVVTETYHATYNYTLIVGAIDSFGIFGYTSRIVSVINFIIDVGVFGIAADPQQGVPVGTPVTISAIPENSGTQSENVTLRLFIEGQGEVKNQNYTLQRFCFSCRDATPMIYRWDTSKLTPKAYLVQARVDHIKGDNDTSNDLYLAYVQIVAPLGPSTVSLSLLSTASISVLALIAVGAAVLILRPKPRDEPLEQETSGST